MEEQVTVEEGMPDAADAGETAREFVAEVLEAMGLEATVTSTDVDEGYRVDIEGPDCALVIGRQGSTLNALQFLVSLVVNKRVGRQVRLVLDAEGYRARREETLRDSALDWAERVKETGQECVLDPMSAAERRIVHTALANDPDVYTYSEGDEPQRCVVISPRLEGDEDEEGEEGEEAE